MRGATAADSGIAKNSKESCFALVLQFLQLFPELRNMYQSFGQFAKKRQTNICEQAYEFVVRQSKSLISKNNLTKPPFSPQRLAESQGIKVSLEDLGTLSGLVLPLNDTFEIKINARHSVTRQNFSCAHELAHTFFKSSGGKLLMGRIERQEGMSGARKIEEDLCDVGASELLMPQQVFKKTAENYNFSLTSLVPLSHLFEISIIPAALRLCDIIPQRCSLILWTKKDDSKLHASWFTWSRKKILSKTGRFLFNPKTVCAESTIMEAYLSDKLVRVNDRVRVGTFVGDCHMWSQGFDSGPSRFVLSLIFPEIP